MQDATEDKRRESVLRYVAAFRGYPLPYLVRMSKESPLSVERDAAGLLIQALERRRMLLKRCFYGVSTDTLCEIVRTTDAPIRRALAMEIICRRIIPRKPPRYHFLLTLKAGAEADGEGRRLDLILDELTAYRHSAEYLEFELERSRAFEVIREAVGPDILKERHDWLKVA